MPSKHRKSSKKRKIGKEQSYLIVPYAGSGWNIPQTSHLAASRPQPPIVTAPKPELTQDMLDAYKGIRPPILSAPKPKLTQYMLDTYKGIRPPILTAPKPKLTQNMLDEYNEKKPSMRERLAEFRTKQSIESALKNTPGVVYPKLERAAKIPGIYSSGINVTATFITGSMESFRVIIPEFTKLMPLDFRGEQLSWKDIISIRSRMTPGLISKPEFYKGNLELWALGLERSPRGSPGKLKVMINDILKPVVDAQMRSDILSDLLFELYASDERIGELDWENEDEKYKKEMLAHFVSTQRH